MEKVIEFYKKQSGLKFIGGDQTGVMFKKGPIIDITVQSPWKDPKTGKVMKDTLITFMKLKQK